MTEGGFPNRGRQKFHTIRQKTVFDIRMLKMSRLHHGTRHVEINDAVASSQFPKLERQCGFKFFLMQAKEQEGLSNYSITSSIRLLEYCGTVKGVKHSTASSISLHIYRFLWVFFMKLLPLKMEVLNWISLLAWGCVNATVWRIIMFSLDCSPSKTLFSAFFAKERKIVLQDYCRLTPHTLTLQLKSSGSHSFTENNSLSH